MTKEYGTPGPRAIVPDMARSPNLARCDPLAQLLFDRIVAACDDQGRMQAVVAVIKGDCLPLVDEATPKRLSLWLRQLEDEKLITRYQAEGYELLQVVKWWSYQKGMRWAYPSRYPAPDGWTDTIRIPPSERRGSSDDAPTGRGTPSDGTPRPVRTVPQSSEDFGARARRDARGNGTGTGNGSSSGDGDGSVPRSEPVPETFGPPGWPELCLLVEQLTSRPYALRDPNAGLGQHAADHLRRRGLPAVTAAYRATAKRAGPGPTPRQIVLGADELLDPIPGRVSPEAAVDAEYERSKALTKARKEARS